MKKSLLSTAAIAGLVLNALLLVNCAGSKPGSGFVDPTPPEMRELIDQKFQKAIWVIGTAEGPNEGIATRKAEMQGRAEIAREFKSQVDALQKSYEEAVNDKSLEEYKQTIEIFSSIELVGSSTEKTMVRQMESGQYQAKILMVVSAEQFKALVDNKMNALTSFKASQAYKELEARVAQEKASQSTVQ